jgi:cell wall-associated NlpC family hydrolase
VIILGINGNFSLTKYAQPFCYFRFLINILKRLFLSKPNMKITLTRFLISAPGYFYLYLALFLIGIANSSCSVQKKAVVPSTKSETATTSVNSEKVKSPSLPPVNENLSNKKDSAASINVIIVEEKGIRKRWSDSLNVKPEEITNIALFKLIEKWWGTNYMSPPPNPLSKETGIDCSGFASLVLKEIYDKVVKGSAKDIYLNYCEPISKCKLSPGDLVFFSSDNSKNNIYHVGVYIGYESFVHATSTKSAKEGKGLMISSLNDSKDYWDTEFAIGGFAGRIKKKSIKEVKTNSTAASPEKE